MKTITRKQYFTAYAFFVTVRKLLREANVFEKLLEDIFGKTSRILDVLYELDDVSMDEFKNLLDKSGVTIDWNGDLLKNEQAENETSSKVQ